MVSGLAQEIRFWRNCSAYGWGALVVVVVSGVLLTELVRIAGAAPTLVDLVFGLVLALYLAVPKAQWWRTIGVAVSIDTLAALLLNSPLLEVASRQGAALTTAALLRGWNPRLTLATTVRDFARSFIVMAGMAAIAASSTPILQGLVREPTSAGLLMWGSHTVALLLGALLLLPVLQTAGWPPRVAELRPEISRESREYLIAVLIIGSGIGWLSPSSSLAVIAAAGAILGLQVWAGLRLSSPVISIGLLLLTAALLVPTHWSRGPLLAPSESPVLRSLELQLFLLMLTVATQISAVWMRETRAGALRDSRYQSVVDDQAELIVRWRPDGQLLFANAATRRFQDPNGGSRLVHSFFERMSAAEVQALRDCVEALSARAPNAIWTQEVHQPEGTIVWLEWTHRGFFADNGALAEIQSIGRDISERRILEDSVRDRLRFEELLARIGRLFLDAQRGHYEVTLEEALAELGRYFAADRIRLVEMAEESGYWRVLTEYWAGGLTTGGAWGHLETTDLWNSAGWLAEQTMLGSTVVVARLDDLPSSALEERRELEACSVKSMLQVPLRTGGVVLGALCIEAVRQEQAWPAATVERVRLVSGLIADVLARARFENSIRFREDFERLIGDASSRFVNCDARRIPQEISRLLDRVGTFLQIDRCQFVELGPDRVEAFRRDEWCAPGVDPLPESGRRLVEQEFHRLAPNLSPTRVRQIARVEDLPQDESLLRSVLTVNQVRSLVIIPVLVELEPIGMLTLATLRRSREWPPDRLPLLAMVGDLLGHALQRERIARNLDQQREQLALASRLSVMGEMAAGIAHDVKQPLHAIRAFSASIERATSAAPGAIPTTPEKLAYWAGRISELVDRADGIVCKYRDFCRTSTREQEPVFPADLLRNSLALVQTEFQEHRVEVTVDTDDDLPRIVGDNIQLQQVLVNLLKNACDELTETEAERRHVSVTAHAEHRGDEDGVRFSIRDLGRGVEPGAAERLFTLFFTTKPHGTGLGLAICHTIVADHRGQIWFESADPGVTFHVWLPCATETAP